MGSQHPLPNAKNALQLWAECLARNYHVTWCQKCLFQRLKTSGDVDFLCFPGFFSTTTDITSPDCFLLIQVTFTGNWKNDDPCLMLDRQCEFKSGKIQEIHFATTQSVAFQTWTMWGFGPPLLHNTKLLKEFQEKFSHLVPNGFAHPPPRTPWKEGFSRISRKEIKQAKDCYSSFFRYH